MIMLLIMMPPGPDSCPQERGTVRAASQLSFAHRQKWGPHIWQTCTIFPKCSQELSLT